MALGLIGSQTHRHTIRLVQAVVVKKRVIIRLEGNTISKHQKSVSLGGLNSLPSPNPHHTPRIRMSGPQQPQSLGSLWVTRTVAGVAAQAGSEADWPRVSAPCPSCSLSPVQPRHPWKCMLQQQAPLKQAGSGTTADGSNLLHSLCLVFKNTDPCSR